MALTVRDVAEYFLTRVDTESGDSLSNLKLQKLVYYAQDAQGYHLALFGKPLFNERIEAWEHGPVIPDLYRIYEQSKSQSIPPPDNFDLETFDSETRELLEEVFEVYGQFSASKRRNIVSAGEKRSHFRRREPEPMRPVKPFIGRDAVRTLIQILKIFLKTLRSCRTMLDSANAHAHVDEPQSWKRPRCTVSITGSLRQFTSLSVNHSISYTTASLRFDAHVPTDGAGGYLSVAGMIGLNAPFGGLAASVKPRVLSVSRRP